MSRQRTDTEWAELAKTFNKASFEAKPHGNWNRTPDRDVAHGLDAVFDRLGIEQ